jgi:hypothetical protein
MIDYNAALFEFPQEIWDAKKCKKLANYTAKDGMGTKHPRKGYLGSSASIPPAFGTIRYNGGCIHDGVWYQGENRPLPKIADGYEIIVISSWGWYIVEIDNGN